VERHNLHINKGVELILKGEPKPKEEHNAWEVNFGKIVSLFNREYKFIFKVSLGIKNK
tara:strand:- start:5873 stop:6046 length:174 start_codon:yes stop_codon:yes gene_type:complete